jgi:hypothetical protein
MPTSTIVPPVLPETTPSRTSAPPAPAVAPPRPPAEVDEHPGDRVALLFWLICFFLLGLMAVLDPLLSLFR